MPTAAKSAASPKKLPQKEKDKEKKNKKEKKEKKADKGEPAEAVPVDAPKDKKEKKDKKDKKAKKDKKQKDALDPTAEVPANEDDAFDAFIDDTEMALPVEPPAEGQRQGNEGDQQEALDNLFADDDLELGEAGLDDVVKETTADAKEYVSTAATITEDASAEPSSSIPNKAERSSITLSKECIGLLTKDDHCLAKRIQRVLNVMLEVRDDSLKVFFDPLPTHEKEQSEAAETMARDVLEAVDNTRSESMTEFSEQTLEKLPATVVQVPEESISDILKEFGSFYPEEFDVILLFGEDSSRKAQEAPLAAGDSVEAKYKEKWYDATVAGLEDDQVKVKYIYNGSVEVLPRDHVRRKEVGQLVRVVLVGNDPRERQAARLKVYRALGPRFSWYFSGAQAPGEELGTEIGLQIFDLRSGWLSKAKNDGVLERVRISCKTCFNCAVEFVNDRAFVSGDRQERDACMALFEVLQSSGDQLDSVPQALENVFLELSLSEEVASKILSQGWGSGNLHTIEEAEKVFIRKLKMDSDGKHRLGIFGGSLRDRLNAKLQLMRVVEAEKPGSFDDQKIALPHDPRFCEPGFETSTQPCGEAEVQQLSSSDGSAWTRRAAAAAHCVAGLVGKTLHLGGTSSERERGFNYIEWMMAALKEEVPKVTVRDDMTVLDMPQEKKKNLPLHVRKHVEEEHEIFSFFSSPIELEAPLASVTARLLLCGHTSVGRTLTTTMTGAIGRRMARSPGATQTEVTRGRAGTRRTRRTRRHRGVKVSPGTRRRVGISPRIRRTGTSKAVGKKTPPGRLRTRRTPGAPRGRMQVPAGKIKVEEEPKINRTGPALDGARTRRKKEANGTSEAGGSKMTTSQRERNGRTGRRAARTTTATRSRHHHHLQQIRSRLRPVFLFISSHLSSCHSSSSMVQLQLPVRCRRCRISLAGQLSCRHLPSSGHRLATRRMLSSCSTIW
eukprot:TRINITY_DN6303_c0_g2_i3.p1 TRINITY_DN6303_c0_g2~~TRINITY_DN6303_c0_g2_i3.p1  ORF type:complete len:953 (+),score=240.43 TRINITY_DN6303_c0_g2_i3:86-2944(+)